MTIDAKISDDGNEVIFTDTNGDSEILNITSGGIISMPQQPLAICWNPDDITTVGDLDSIKFGNVSTINRGITYDSDTFTFSQKGVYSVSFTLSGSAATIDVGDGIGFALYVNNSIYGGEDMYGYTTSGALAGEEWHYSIPNILIDIDVNDGLRLRAINVGSAGFSVRWGNISVVKVA